MQGKPPKGEALEKKLFELNDPGSFEQMALEIFHFQHAYNPLYRQYCQLIQRKPDQVAAISDIPFLPISFFKSSEVKTTDYDTSLVFESSGTTGSINSKHYIKDPLLYETSFTRGFLHFYGNVQDYAILGLLPSYLERGSSSLVYMVQSLMRKSNHPANDFFLHDFERLRATLLELEAAQQKTLVIGVTYALLDFAEQFPMDMQNTLIMETGGMKGRKKERTREEVHAFLKSSFGVNAIHSEYGMTELLSQAYAYEKGFFQTPPWMKVLLRGEDDPLTLLTGPGQQSGIINIIDLANLWSCSFIATDDVGRLQPDGRFEVLGRLDNADIRGCSLLVV